MAESRSGRRALALLAVAALWIGACGSDDDGGDAARSDDAEAPQGEPIVIGMLEDTSGGTAFTSEQATNGIELAVEEINADGGVLGRPLRIIRQSDGSEPSQAPPLVRRLIEDGAVAVLTNSGSASAAQVKPVAVEEQVLALSPTNIATNIATPPDNAFSFILANPVNDVGSAYAAAFQEAGIDRIALFADDSPTIAGLSQLLVPIIEEAGVTVPVREAAPLDATDYTAQASRIADADVDAILVVSLGGQPEVLFHNTAAELMPDVPRFSIASIGNQPETWDLARPGALEGVVYIASISPDNERSSDLADRLGVDASELTAFAAQGYDSVHLLRDAIEAAGTADDPVAIKDAFEAISGYEPHFGQPGFTISFGPDKHIGTDGLCGILLRVFDAENAPGGAWDTYQPACE